MTVSRWVFDHRNAFPFRLLRSILSAVYNLLFGRLDRRSALKREAKLRQEIRDALPFLFDKHRGRIVPNEGVSFPPGFDYALVTIAVDDLLIRFIRGRGELGVVLASQKVLTDWYALSVLADLVRGNDSSQRSDILGIQDASRLLESHLGQIGQVFANNSKNALRELWGGIPVAGLRIDGPGPSGDPPRT